MKYWGFIIFLGMIFVANPIFLVAKSLYQTATIVAHVVQVLFAQIKENVLDSNQILSLHRLKEKIQQSFEPISEELSAVKKNIWLGNSVRGKIKGI